MRTSTWRDFLLLSFLGCVLICAGVGFLLPWITLNPPGGRTINRYLLPDGHAALYMITDNTGKLLGWSSLNAAKLPPLNGMAYVLQPEVGIYLMENYPELLRERQNWAIYRMRNRNLLVDGSVYEQDSVHLLSPQGLYLVAISIRSENSNLIFDPPALVIPANLPHADSWDSQGKIGEASYVYHGQVTGQKTIDGPIGSLPGCVQLESRLELSQDDQVFFSQTGTDWLCPGAGTAEWLVSPSTGVVEHAQLLSSSLRSSPSVNTELFPPSSMGSTPESSLLIHDSPITWKLNRLGEVDSIGTNTLFPSQIPGDSSHLFAAHSLGELVVFHSSGDLTGQKDWSVHTGALVFGQPAFDPATGLIIFGASNKLIYAYDQNGLFRWAFQAMDNLPARPLVIGSQVIVGSEDGWVYALEIASGSLNWRARAGTSMASAPALLGDLAVFANDDGSVYAFKWADGTLEWTFSASGGVDAPLVVDGNTLFIATRDGNLIALDEDGAQLWGSFLGNTIHTSPVINGSIVFVVDEVGRLHAINRENGSRLWQAPGDDYLGPPGRAGEGVIVVNGGHELILYDAQGNRMETSWDLCDLQPVDKPCDPYQPLGFYSGPYPGEGAYWFADEARGLYRLGP